MLTSVEGWANEGVGVLEFSGRRATVEFAKEGVKGEVGVRSFEEGGHL